MKWGAITNLSLLLSIINYLKKEEVGSKKVPALLTPSSAVVTDHSYQVIHCNL